MKKTVLLMAAGLAAVAANAQSVQMAKEATRPTSDLNFSTAAQLGAKVHQSQVVKHTATLAGKAQEAAAVDPITSVANGVYYNKPAGTLFQTYGADGYGWAVDILMFRAYEQFDFIDQSANPALSKWLFGTNDASQNVDEKDNRTFHFMGASTAEGRFYYAPTLKNGSGFRAISYTIGEEGYYAKQGNATCMSATSGITPMSFLSDHSCTNNYYGWSSWNNDHYLFGTGSTTNDEDGTTEIFIGAMQSFPAPMSPLYVESIDLPVFTFDSKNPMKDGELALEVYLGESEEAAFVLTANADDFNFDLDDQGEIRYYDTDYNKLYVGHIHFAIKGIDAFGTPTEEPFVINDEFTVAIYGFDKVNIGMGSTTNLDPDGLEGSGVITNQGHVYHYQSPLSFNISINGLLDNILNNGDVEATDGNTYPTWYVMVSEDGATYQNGIFTDLEGALFYTACEWFTEDGDENYSIYYADNFPEWITSIVATEYGEPQEGAIADTYQIGFTAEPLPADVKGRGYFVFLEGRGIVCEDPIFVYQGDAQTAWDMALETLEEPEALTAVRVDNNKQQKAYSLFGQQVNGNYKGIVIVNGQKQIRL